MINMTKNKKEKQPWEYGYTSTHYYTGLPANYIILTRDELVKLLNEAVRVGKNSNKEE